MMQQNKLVPKILQEILWLFIIAIISFALFYPIIMLGTYKFLWINLMYIAVAIMYSRWTVNFKEIDYLKNKWFKIFIFLINFQLFIFSVNKLQDMIPLWETQSLLEYIYHIKKEMSLEHSVMYLAYIKNLILISGIASCIATVFLSVRILTSFFTSNKKRKDAMIKDL